MQEKVKKLKVNYPAIVFDYFTKQQKLKHLQESFDKIKAGFASEMNKYFDEDNKGSKAIFNMDEFVDEMSLIVNRVQKSSVNFNADKLEKVLGKEISKDVIIKRHEIIDIDGLVEYLKQCGVDPSIFKSFIVTTKSVDVQALERLDEVGKLKGISIDDCFTLKSNEPYFTVKMSKGKGNE